MALHIFIYIVLLAVSGVLSIFLGIYAYMKRKIFFGSKAFISISLFSAIYTFGHAFELASNSLPMIVFWTSFQYLGLPHIAPITLILVAQYIGMERFITKKTIFIIFIVPIMTTVMVVTNPVHHLFYQSVFLESGSAPLIGFVIGPWYIVHGSYTFASLLAGGLLILQYWRQTKSTYWKQNLIMLLGLYLPMISSFLYLLGLTPYGIDPVPIVLSITSALYIFAFLSSHFLVIAPIARGVIFDNMRDGVIVLDAIQRIIDFNSAAKKIISSLDDTQIGQPLQTLWKDVNKEVSPFPQLNDYNPQVEFELEWQERSRDYQIHSTPVRKNRGVIGSTIVIVDVTEQRRLQKRLERLAYIDALTNILNRTAFLEKSLHVIDQLRRLHQPVTIAIFDIDHFKRINDTYGHHTGDDAIRHVVDICKNLLQETDLFGRYGGEEFVLCLPAKNLAEAGEFAEILRKNIEAAPLYAAGELIQLTASFGVAEVFDGNQITEALSQADQALYASKHSGRNAVYLSDKTLYAYNNMIKI